MVKRKRLFLNIVFWTLLLASLVLNIYLLRDRYSGEPRIEALLPNTLDRCYVVYFPGNQQRADVACVAIGGK